MKKICLFILFCLFIGSTTVKAIDVSAKSAILVEQGSGRILYSKNIHSVQSVASISKIMTALLAVESGKLNEMVTIGDEIKDAYGSAIYIKQGEKMTLEDLTYGLMLRSGNDAAIAIATYISGNTDAFVEKMNEKAKQLGMKNTTFHNPHGLDEGNMKGNFSTAYDMALLTRAANQNKIYRKIVRSKIYKTSTNKNHYVWNNKNKLLKTYKYTTGGKTGFTKKARRTLVSSAKKDGLSLVTVTLNDGNDFEDHKNLFEYGFSTYKNYKILQKGVFNIYDDKYYKDYNLYVKNDLFYPMIESEKNHVVLKIELEKNRKYKRNSQVGKVIITVNGEEIGEEKLYIQGLKQEQTGIFAKIKKWFIHD